VEQGVAVSVFDDSSDLLASESPFGYDFYVVDLMLPGVDGDEMIRILRRRTDAGVLVVSGKVGASVFEAVIDAGCRHVPRKAGEPGADPLGRESAAPACRAGAASASKAGRWNCAPANCSRPDGAKVEAERHRHDGDPLLPRCRCSIVTRDTLVQRLGRDNSSTLDNTLHATIYRLRRRIEKASTSLVPLQSEPRIG